MNNFKNLSCYRQIKSQIEILNRLFHLENFCREMTFFLEIKFNKNEALEDILLRMKTTFNGLISVLYSTFVNSDDLFFDLSPGIQELLP